MPSETDFLTVGVILRQYSHTSGIWKEPISIWYNKFD